MVLPSYDARGDGPAVVFLHSFPLDRAMWASQMAAVTAAGKRAVAVDLPGFGDTPVTATPSLDACADAVVHLLDHLGIARVTIVGLSLGGYVSLALWRRAPSRMDALVLADTRATADTPAVKASRVIQLAVVRSQGPAAILDRLIQGLLAADTPADTRDSIRTIAARQRAEGISYALLAMRDRPDATPLLPTITVPTLVLVGEHDTVTPPSEMAAMAQSIPGACFEPIAGAGHLSNMEQPEAFNASLVRFLHSA